MKILFTLIVFITLSTGSFNQINAQIPISILTKEINYVPDYQDLNCLLNGLHFFSITNDLSVKKVKLKAAQAEKELLDSIVYLETYEGVIYGGNKTEMNYDVDGNKKSQCSYYWDTEIKAWRGRQKADSTYDANGNLSMIIRARWNNETRQWVPGEKNEMTYNSDGDQILYTVYSWNSITSEWEWDSKTESSNTYTIDSTHIILAVNYIFENSTGLWVPHHRNEVNYDSNGHMTLYNASLLDSTTNSWVFKDGCFKYERTYDKKGNQTLSSYYNWDSELDQWIGAGDLVETSYDLLGNTSMVVIKEWDDTLNQWVNSRKTESGYNGIGQELQNSTFKWDKISGNWLAFHQTENSYNENGTISRVTDSEWVNKQNKLVGISQRRLIYDAKGNLSQSNILKIDTVSGEWYAYSKDEYKYDVDNNELLKESYKLNDNDQLVVYYKKETVYNIYGNVILCMVYETNEESDAFVKSNETRYTYNESGDKLIEVAESIYYDGIPFVLKTNFYYSIHSVTSSINIKTEALSVYPNPFLDQLSFHLNNKYDQIDFELFDYLGRKVMSKSVLNSEAISVIGLDRGVYIYKLSFDDKTQTGKLIKK